MIPPFSTDEPMEVQLDKLVRTGHRFAAAGKRAAAMEIWHHILQRTPAPYRTGRWIDDATGSVPQFEPLMNARPKTRIYILGCGRSGTWLTLAMMGGFKDVHVAPEERHYGHFARLVDQPEGVHVVKRTHSAHALMTRIPQAIHLLYVLRDPRDVLTSSHHDTEFYISLERWSAEMASLEAVLETGRPGLVVTRFEDLITQPLQEQARIAEAFNLEIDWPADRFNERFKAEDIVYKGMHGLRPPDPSVIGRWRTDARKRAYLDTVREPVQVRFTRLADRFGYDIADW